MSALREKENEPLSPGGPVPLAMSEPSHAESPLARLRKTLSFKSKALQRRSQSDHNVLQRSAVLSPALGIPPPLLPDSVVRTRRPGRARSEPGREGSSQGAGDYGDDDEPRRRCPPTSPRIQPGCPERRHSFQDHSFKKPTFCDVCNRMIVGTDVQPVSKLGIRCKTCKMSVHQRCQACVNQQRCVGKMPKGFRRQSSSPLLLNGQFACIKEVMPLASGNKLDPVYEALRYGTSLAQQRRAQAAAGEAPCSPREDSADLCETEEEDEDTNGEGPEGRRSWARGVCHTAEGRLRKLSLDDKRVVFSQGGTLATERHHNADLALAACPQAGERDRWQRRASVPASAAAARRDFSQLYTFVALHRFGTREKDDLALEPGDRLSILDDSNEEWWKGKLGDRVGYFPANFVVRVRPGERVFQALRTFVGNKQLGQLTLKQEQWASVVGGGGGYRIAAPRLSSRRHRRRVFSSPRAPPSALRDWNGTLPLVTRSAEEAAPDVGHS
ncbi:SH3 and cysteine-rich domain-containing protein-like isoform X1 [Lethenteron reissneri]|uniref:SH3 and cysteine-rich domain-containing protein-like isoform X1 n=1 Tax=Lethenteron reissneri TaxID=7753 RepID=UPI002AB67D62|nr:SH3 and cysteine-rich domain-containing protein-like isoform X1 [Lethenteron reissneri]